MSTSVYISRNFVEFGPFKPAEILDFHSRGILGELDHVREESQDDWVFISEWVAKAKPSSPTPASPKPAVAKPKAAPAAATPPAAKKAAVKAAPAKKAAAKKAAK